MSKLSKCSVFFLIVLMAGCSGLQMRPDIKPDLEGRISKSGLDIDLDGNDAVDVAYGGTNATSAADARTSLGLGTAAVAATGDFEAAGAVTSHAGAADPHTGYMLESNIGTGANNYPKLGATPGTPDGTKFYRDDNTWAVPSGEVLSTAALWDAAGDLVQGTGANTAAKLTKGAQGTILQAGASTNAWSSYTLPTTVPTTGKVLISDGTNLVGSTALGTAAYAATTAFEAADADLAAIAALACTENQIIKRNGAGAWICAADTGSSPGGSATQLQFNSAGTALGGISTFTYNGTKLDLTAELALGVGGSITGIGTMNLGGIVLGDSSPDADGEIAWVTNAYLGFGGGEDWTLTSGANLWTWSSTTGATYAFTPSVGFTAGLIVADGQTITFDESAADPDDADIQLSATDGVFKIAAANGANNEDLTFDLDGTSNTVTVNTTTGVTGINFSDLNLSTTGDISSGTANDPFLKLDETDGTDWWIGIDDTGNSLEFRINATVGNSVRAELSETTGLIVTPPATQTIASGNTVTADACGTIKMITAGGAVTTDTTNTFTAPAASNLGCILHVINVGAQPITLDNNALFVSAGGADVVLGAGDTVTVASTGASGKWYQIGATGNN